jgi:hypothetical protein
MATTEILLRPLTIGQGATRSCRRVIKSYRHKPVYELITRLDGEEYITVAKTEASAMMWIDQARKDASDYAADLDMIAYNKQAAKDRKLAHRAAQPQQLALAF